MNDWLSRTELLLGKEALEKLTQARVLMAGLGGVGGFTAELLVRAGVQHLILADSDTVESTNLNRQLLALRSTLGKPKAEVARARFLDINPKAEIIVFPHFIEEGSLDDLLGSLAPSLVVDAIDTLAPKIALIEAAHARNIPLVSSMGSGRRWQANRVRQADIWSTQQCPLASAVRKGLRQKGLTHLHFPTVYSEEPPRPGSVEPIEGERNKRSRVGVISYIPAMFGAMLADLAVRSIIGQEVD